jgi:hypothetical protein
LEQRKLLYVAAVWRRSGKRKRQDETQFITQEEGKDGMKLSLSPKLMVFCVSSPVDG